ncbi:hypothetical protein HRED_09977 [Candidatus Haloredivivus sp. G17]|nr:hypothetical protein HRED_09977 [Candidatus Haloredivivus sp. G17]
MVVELGQERRLTQTDEEVEESEQRLADEAWEKLEVEKASVIVSAIDDSKLVHKIEGLDVEAEKIVLTSDSDEVRDELREMLSEALK